MGKTRLTNADREAIRDAIIRHKFAPIEAALAAEEAALAVQVRAKAVGDLLAVLDAAPAGAFPAVDSISVNVGGRRIRLAFTRGERSGVRVFFSHQYDNALSVTDSDALGKKVLAWAERSEATRTERRDLAGQLTGTLSAFRSFDDLQKGWPEADRFITERWRKRPDYSANVPAVTIQALTEALDLPPDMAEAA